MKLTKRKPDMTPQKTPMKLQPPVLRTKNFDEVAQGYTPEQAVAEAERCMNCPGRYCATSCPLHVPIPEFISKIRAGDFAGAHALISAVNPVPAISGRICPQECQCECNCTRGIKGEPVAIGRLERFVADWSRTNHSVSIQPPIQNGKRVAIVGAGPAGLACAGQLAAQGYQVTVFEKEAQSGGIPVHGIPSFVLPRPLLQEQLERLASLGVVIKNGVQIGVSTTLSDLQNDGFQAIFVANGAPVPVHLTIPGEQLDGVHTASDYLLQVNAGTCSHNMNGQSIVIVGGGNTAIDAARCARRLGAQTVTLLYRRSEAEMPARREEIARAREEGVDFRFLSAPVSFLGNSAGAVTAVECVDMEFTAPDWPGGRKNVKAIAGATHSIPADTVVLALGYLPNPVPGLKADTLGRLQVEKDGVTTTLPGVFAGGDAVTGAATYIRAVNAGLTAAQAISLYLS